MKYGDLIDRQDAIEAINTWDKFGVDERGRLVRWHEGLVLYVRLRDVLTAIVNLPSAQPELIEKAAYIRGFEQGRTQGMIDTKAEEVTQTNLQPTCNQLATDTISRQAAIDVVRKNTFRLTFAEERGCEGHVAWSAEAVYSDVIEGALLELPSAQPEIIRCKDCRHGVDYYHEGDCYCSNPKWGLKYFGGSWEFYCADAERRTDETD